jgi:Uma2 family endonuclease
MNAPVVPKMNVAQFLDWSQRQQDDRHELVDGEIIALTRDVHHQRNERGTIVTRIAHNGDIALVPPGISVPVVALLGPTRSETGST